MTHEEKVKRFTKACNMQNISIDERTAEQIIETYKAVLKKGRKFSSRDAVEIENAIARKYLEREKANKNKILIEDFIDNNEMSARLKMF
jgi:hypothetical protein